MSNSMLRDMSKEFAKKTVFLCRQMKIEHKEGALVGQLLRCATSIGANIYEAQYAQSKKDFISKLEIAQKECYETEYWLEIMQKAELLSEETNKGYLHDCGAIRRMLIASINTAKEKN